MLIAAQLFGCASVSPYVGANPENPQFERGMPFLPLDLFGDLISKIIQLLLWTPRYGNHRVSPETEKALAEFLDYYDLHDVKVRINQWAPHKEIWRLITNHKMGIPYRVVFFPSTLIAAIIGRPTSGLLISDFYSPASNSIHIFSDEITIALHEAGHAHDFANQRWKGTYVLARAIPGINLVQESIATDDALHYLEIHENYEELIRGYKILIPAYATYVGSYFNSSLLVSLGSILLGHITGRARAQMKIHELRKMGKLPPKNAEVAIVESKPG